MVELLEDEAALERIGSEDIIVLTEAATDATFHVDGLTAEQVAANRRIVAISAESCLAAATNPNQLFAAGFVDGHFAGYVIAIVHAPDDRELDWIMVHPDFHGTGVATALMEAGIDWLGGDRPLWLNVIRSYERAIGFCRKFGFEVDPEARTGHLVPHVIMRRTAA